MLVDCMDMLLLLVWEVFAVARVSVAVIIVMVCFTVVPSDVVIVDETGFEGIGGIASPITLAMPPIKSLSITPLLCESARLR